MMKKPWTKAEERILKQFYPKNGVKATCDKLKRSKSSVGGHAKKLGFTVNKAVSKKLRIAHKVGTTSSTPAMDKVIRKCYLTHNYRELGEKLGKSESWIPTRIRQLGLKIPKAIMQKRILSARIKPGQVPPNKGKTWAEYMPKESQERAKKTTFKKGQLPGNTLHDGAITLRHSHKKRGNRPYYWLRIKQAKWRMLHVWLWEKYFGPVPKEHIIVFRDKNSCNVVKENLECITRAEHAQRNRNPAKLKAAMLEYWKNNHHLSSDEYIASLMAQRDKGLRALIIKDKELIAIKRAQITLQRKLKTHEINK